MSPPFVSCICVTYGRLACLEEAIQFFLTQDYQGSKELIVVNDLGQQSLMFDHPDIRIFNLQTRFKSLGAKRDFAIGQSRGDVIVIWDDDDGYLPAHLTECVRLLENHDYAKPDRCFVWIGANNIERISGSFMAQIVFTKDIYMRSGGYGDRSYGEDMSLSERMLSLPGVRANFATIADEEITFLFRWANGEYHLSGYGPDQPGQQGYEQVGLDVQNRIGSGQLCAGTVLLHPAFEHDYQLMVNSYLRSLSQVVPARLLKKSATVIPTRLWQSDLLPPWSASIWVAKQSHTDARPIALFDSQEFSIRLSQFGDLSKFGVTRYGHRDWTFGFAPEANRLTHIALVARPRAVALYVDGQPVDTLRETVHFPTMVTDERSLVEYRIFSGTLASDEILGLAAECPSKPKEGARIRLKFTTNWIGDEDFAQYLSKMTQGNGVWNCLEIVQENEDYAVVVNHPGDERILDPRKTIYLRMEPESTRQNWGPWYRPDASTAELVFDERNSLEWGLSLSHAELSRTVPKKSRVLSSVVSDLEHMEGHRLRLRFVREYLAQLPYFDHFGRGYHSHQSFRGQVAHKEDALFPYSYTFAAENCCEPGYFTEKLVDAILSECLVFYWGCPDLERWIDPGCFIRVDLHDPAHAIDVVRESIERGEREKRLDVIRREKLKILNELQIFPTIELLLRRSR